MKIKKTANFVYCFCFLSIILALTGCQHQELPSVRTIPPRTPASSPLPTQTFLPLPTQTFLPLPTQTFLPLPTQTTSSVSTLPASEDIKDQHYSDEVLDGPIILEYLPGGEIFLQDVNTGETRELPEHVKIYQEGFLGWTKQSCGFYVRLKNYNIVEVDLHGNLIREVFEVSKLNSLKNDKKSFGVKLSPLESHVAFTVGDGVREEYLDHGYHYSREDLVVGPIGNPENSNIISQRGGAWTYEWSPDGSKLVYTDFDLNGLFQVYVADIYTGERTQISEFSETGKIPMKFLWSQEGNFIALLFLREGPGVDVLISRVEGGHLIPIENLKQIWWDKNESLAVIKENAVQWIEPLNGNLTKSVEFPNSLVTPQLFGSMNKIACLWDCFGNKGYGLYVYDLETRSTVSFPNLNPILGAAYWISAESVFPGESNCK